MSLAGVRIMCTLGPASLNPVVIRELDARHVDLLRINLSHTRIEDLRAAIDLIRACSDVPISLDTEGAQVVADPWCPVSSYRRARRSTSSPRPCRAIAEDLASTPVHLRDARAERHDDDRLPGSIAPRDRAARERCPGRRRARRSGRLEQSGDDRAAASLPSLTRKDVAAIELGRAWGSATTPCRSPGPRRTWHSCES